MIARAPRSLALSTLGKLAILGVVACGADNGITDASTVDGIKYTARITSIVSIENSQINVIATLQNVTSATKERTYPVGCAVRVRLYRPADGFKMYDETKRPCANETPATLSIPAGETRELASGVRFTATILGDSLPHTTYLIKVVVMTEGSGRVLEVVAGEWTFQ